MEIMILVLLLGCIAGLIMWRRMRGLEWQLRRIRQSIDEMAKKRRPDKKKATALFRSLYAVINQALVTNQSDLIYHSADTLKLAIGTRLGQRDEPLRLMAVTVAAIKAKQPDGAGHLLDAFRPLVRRWGPEILPGVLNPLMMVANVAMKEKHNFLTAKVLDLVFIVLERPDCQVSEPALKAAFRAIRTLGLLAVRRRDEALFRELAKRINDWAFNAKKLEAAPEVAHCLYAWLHRIIKTNDESLASILDEMAEILIVREIIQGQALHELLNGWTQLAGNAILNPNSQLAQPVIARITAVALATEDIVVFRRIVRGLVQVSSMALTRYNMREAFLIIWPLADAGRKLLQAELTFGPSIETEFRPQALHIIVRELLLAFEILARQRMTTTAGEVIGEFCELWQQHPATAAYYGKAARKFCQLLLSFWLQNRKAKSRRFELVGPVKEQLKGFSPVEQTKLGFILDTVR